MGHWIAYPLKQGTSHSFNKLRSPTIRDRVRTIVENGYDRLGTAYIEGRSPDLPPRLIEFINSMAPGIRVLDVGCGSGWPITQRLSERFSVVGVDLSRKNIERARKAIPNAEFLHSDIREATFLPDTFDAIITFYTLSHMSSVGQHAFFSNARQWLKPEGLLLCTLDNEIQIDYVKHCFFGTTMYWNCLGMDRYVALISEVGLDLIERGTVDSGYRVGIDGSSKCCPYIIAKKSRSCDE